MATKKENRRGNVRKARRALNSADDIPSKMGNSKLLQSGYGSGVTKRSLQGPKKLRSEEE